MLKFVGKASNPKVFAKAKCIKKDTQNGIYKAFKKMEPIYLKFAKEDMMRKKSGRTYTVYVSRSGRRLKRGRRHVASAEGESPAVLSGKLLRSISVTIRGGSYFTFGVGVDYIKYLEEKRSIVKRTIMENQQQTRRLMSLSIQKELVTL